MLVAIVAHPGVHALEVSALTDAFALANAQPGADAAYEVRILVRDAAAPLKTSSGLRIVGDAALDDVERDIDTIIVTGGADPGAFAPATIQWMRDRAPRARRWGGIGTGAFLLGAAGLLDARRVTTHWRHADALAARHPRARVEPDRLFVRDGPLFTGAGESAAIDLALALIEEDHGRALALEIARELVLYVKRNGDEPQHSFQLAAQSAALSPVETVRAWIRDHPDADLSIPRLAAISAMSVRNFARVFKRETGVSPAAFVEMTRVERARRLLQESDLGVQQAAFRSGFASYDAARRAFLRRTGLTPSHYQRLHRRGP